MPTAPARAGDVDTSEAGVIFVARATLRGEAGPAASSASDSWIRVL